MCGLFGLARPEGAARSTATTRAVLMLGRIAEERGVDAAGVAYRPTAHPESGDPPAERRDAVLDGWRVIKDVGRFGKLPLREAGAELDAARVLLGHTRHATQGDIGRLCNASPLSAGPVLGTHNGDVTAGGLRERYGLPAPV